MRDVDTWQMMLHTALVCIGVAALIAFGVIALACCAWTLFNQRSRRRATRADAAAKAVIHEAYLIVEREVAQVYRERAREGRE